MVSFLGFIIYPLNDDGKISKASVGQRRHPGKAELQGQSWPPKLHSAFWVAGGGRVLRHFSDILFSRLVFEYTNAL